MKANTIDVKQYFQFPLEIDAYYESVKIVWTYDYNRAFDFERLLKNKDGINILDNNIKIKIIEAINKGKTNNFKNFSFSYRNGYVYMNEFNKEIGEILFIRSWGRLTGTGGGLGLSEEKATQIQDAFGNYIINVLNGKT